MVNPDRPLLRWLRPPVVTGSLVQVQTARSLHWLTLTMAVLIGVLVVANLVQFGPTRLAGPAGLGAGMILVQILLRTGRTRLASAVFIGALWLVTAAVTSVAGGVASPTYPALVLLVLCAGLLLGPWAAGVVAALDIALGLVLLPLAANDLLPSSSPPTAAYDLVLAGGTFGATVVILALATWTGRQARAEADLHQQRLVQSEARYRNLVDHAPDGVITIRAHDGAILSWNPAAVRIFGRAPEAVLGRSWRSVGLLEPADVELAAALLRDELAGIDTDDAEWTIRRPDGTVRRISVRRQASIRDGEEVTESIIRDVTAQRALEDRLRHSERVESIGLLAGGVAHDFNNLLTVMAVNLTLLEDEGGGSAETRKALHDTIGRATELTRQLLSFGRWGTQALEALDPSEVVVRCSSLLRRLLPPSILLRVDTPVDDPWLVLADRGRLEQILLNLVVNARYAIGADGVITVGVRKIEEGSERVCIEVRDSGSGMDPETMARVFDPFFTTRDEGGTGLGLAVVRQIVDDLGGTIAVDSAVGEGSRFRIELPRHPRTAHAAPELATTPQEASG